MGFDYKYLDDYTGLVTDVLVGSSAGEAGLLIGDVIDFGESITRIEAGKLITNLNDHTLFSALRNGPATEVLLKTKRGNEVIIYVLINSK